MIHHGIDPEEFPLGRGDGEYLLFLGRMTADKGVRLAVLATRDAGRPLVIAAKAREDSERAYFAEHVAPLMDGDIPARQAATRSSRCSAQRPR